MNLAADCEIISISVQPVQRNTPSTISGNLEQVIVDDNRSLSSSDVSIFSRNVTPVDSPPNYADVVEEDPPPYSTVQRS